MIETELAQAVADLNALSRQVREWHLLVCEAMRIPTPPLPSTSEWLVKLIADRDVLAAEARVVMAKCEQYWNERSPGDAEFHAILEFIHLRFSLHAGGALGRAGK